MRSSPSAPPVYSIRIVQQRSFLLFSRQKQDEVMRLEEQIRAKADQQRKDGQELDSTCQICLKTKYILNLNLKLIMCLKLYV